MSEYRHATAEVARYTLAINDMEDVSAVARLIAEHDPDFHPFGESVAHLAGNSLPNSADRKRRPVSARRRHLPSRA